MVATAMAAVATARAMALGVLTARCSPRITCPSSTATRGSSTSIAGTEAFNEPAWKADCWSRVAATATAISAYVTGEVSSRAAPSSVSSCISILVNTATTPKSTPTPNASRIARRQPDSRTATTRLLATTSRQITATTAAGTSAPS